MHAVAAAVCLGPAVAAVAAAVCQGPAAAANVCLGRAVPAAVCCLQEALDVMKNLTDDELEQFRSQSK